MVIMFIESAHRYPKHVFASKKVAFHSASIRPQKGLQGGWLRRYETSHHRYLDYLQYLLQTYPQPNTDDEHEVGDNCGDVRETQLHGGCQLRGSLLTPDVTISSPSRRGGITENWETSAWWRDRKRS